MKFLVAVATILVLNSAAAEPQPAPKPVAREAPYRAYWLVGADGRGEYLTLLVTHGPVEDLAWHKKWSDLPLDSMAMTFRTYKKDSLWDEPFKLVQQLGAVNSQAKTVVLDGLIFTYESAQLEDVARLMKNPNGTLPISRRKDPLEGAQRTAKAFRFLLQEQLQVERK